MRHKKKSEPEKSSEQAALEKHVDAMMDIKQPDSDKTSGVSEAETAPDPAMTTDTNTAPTAPQLSAKLRRQIGIKDESTEPLHIKKLDELTESMADPKPPKDTSAKTADEASAPQEKADEPERNIEEQSTDLDDAETDKAVDDIVAYEGDVMLAVADSTAEARNEDVKETEPQGHPVLSTVFWAFIIFLVTIIVILGALFAFGSSFSQKLGL
jgi:hypothetical protein